MSHGWRPARDRDDLRVKLHERAVRSRLKVKAPQESSGNRFVLRAVTDAMDRMLVLPENDALATEVSAAIKTGEHSVLRRLLRGQAGLARARLQRRSAPGREEQRSLLHVATDWPANFPGVAETIAVLVEAGVEVNARFVGSHGETPLPWAASSDDVAALDALLDHGADVEASGAVIGGGTPLADAVAFGQWNAARRLVEPGAKTNLWQASALGLTERVLAELDRDPRPAQRELTKALWYGRGLRDHLGDEDHDRRTARARKASQDKDGETREHHPRAARRALPRAPRRGWQDSGHAGDGIRPRARSRARAVWTRRRTRPTSVNPASRTGLRVG